ncbi:mechanosensitive ion channel family protein [Saccharophagus degradans]|uniref:Mechanosensitive ion channel family protein n=1 Tax=Saccharophagus degradans TaxID=86304 RepID=A0AAW7XB96_9GAMM|nr:mechanosensitive ion channel family protein [Saccharophagus degradans]MDO6424132.1 mechanosensitive ion channel family protein [Saccharophagus degradans]MDO6608179.1 mechanosensitive ion channel family protein [Saccharophagus degradans]
MDAFKSTLQEWLGELAGKENLWIAEVFIVVFCTLIVALVVSTFLNKLKKKSLATKTLWDDAFFHSLAAPAKWFVWVLGLTTAATIASKHSESAILEAIATVRHVGYIVIVTWFVTGFISKAEKNLIDPEYSRQPMDRTTAMALGKLLRISVIITAMLVALQSLGYSISGVLAFGGIGGIAVGFAAKDLLANFFGGLMVYLDRPFAVGDWIRSPDKNIEGVVEDIGWRQTRIRTFDKRPLYVPNATFTQISVENPSRMQHRRIYETVGIRYDDATKMAGIVADVKAMLVEHEAIDHNNTLIVNFNGFASSSLDFFIYCFTHTTDWIEFHEIKQDVLLKVLKIIEKHEAECAFPTSTLHVPDGIQLMQAEN